MELLYALAPLKAWSLSWVRKLGVDTPAELARFTDPLVPPDPAIPSAQDQSAGPSGQDSPGHITGPSR